MMGGEIGKGEMMGRGDREGRDDGEVTEKKRTKGEETIKRRCDSHTNIPHEPLALVGKEMLDVGTPGEDPLQVHPAPLHVNPHVKQGVDPVQPVLPGQGVVLKHFVVGRQLHGRH